MIDRLTGSNELAWPRLSAAGETDYTVLSEKRSRFVLPWVRGPRRQRVQCDLQSTAEEQQPSPSAGATTTTAPPLPRIEKMNVHAPLTWAFLFDFNV